MGHRSKMMRDLGRNARNPRKWHQKLLWHGSCTLDARFI